MFTSLYMRCIWCYCWWWYVTVLFRRCRGCGSGRFICCRTNISMSIVQNCFIGAVKQQRWSQIIGQVLCWWHFGSAFSSSSASFSSFFRPLSSRHSDSDFDIQKYFSSKKKDTSVTMQRTYTSRANTKLMLLWMIFPVCVFLSKYFRK